MPLERAFVVQFRGCTKTGSAWFAGRVEHLLSGKNKDFATPKGLTEFFARVLTQQLPERRAKQRK